MITALIPYYGYRDVSSNWSLSNPMNRPGYLWRTVASIRALTGSVILGVRVDDDTVPDIPGVSALSFECEPYLLPANLLRWAQDYQFPGDVYYTEADQVLHFTPEVLSAVKRDDYLVPHRLEQLGQFGEGAQLGPVVSWDDRQWVLRNGAPQGGDFYHPWHPDAEVSRLLQYGAAYLCTSELLSKVTFTDSRHDRPLEHSSGFDIGATGHALKTSNWQEFFVEHLSGYETNEREAGRWDGLTPRG